jgi:hypothetical protein
MDQHEEELRFQERKVNLLSEFASLSSYEIIEIYLKFLKNTLFDSYDD